MSNKYLALETAGSVGASFHALKEQHEQQRRTFLEAVYRAHKNGATQKEIAEHTGFSRQRISQFLAEYERECAHAA